MELADRQQTQDEEEKTSRAIAIAACMAILYILHSIYLRKLAIVQLAIAMGEVEESKRMEIEITRQQLFQRELGASEAMAIMEEEEK